MVITPVRPIGPDSFQRAESVQRTSPPRKTQETQDVSKFISSTEINLKNKDVVALTPGLDGNLESARNAVSAVFERVREQLSNTLGLRGVQNDDAEQLLPPEDATGQEILEFFRPAQTANRIVGFSTSFFEPFLQNRGEEANQENLSEFSALITDAIKKGFAEAKQELGNPDTESEIGKNIERTFQLVLKGIEEFQQSFFERSPIARSAEETEVLVKEIVEEVNETAPELTPPPVDSEVLEEAFAERELINLEPLTNPDAEDLVEKEVEEGVEETRTG